MAEQGKEETKTRKPWETEFAALPLEEKLASLLRMEAATLGETLTFIANSSAKAVEKAGEFINEVGVKIENEVKKASKSANYCPPEGSTDDQKAKEKSASGKRPPKKPPETSTPPPSPGI